MPQRPLLPGALPVAGALLALGLLGAPEARALQTVFLDFDTFTDTGTDPDDFVYSAGERTAVVDTLNDKFASFPVAFTDTLPGSPPFSTVFLNEGLSSSDGVDFQNKKKSDTAEVHAVKNLAVAGNASPTPAEVVAATINLAAHEAMHLLGAAHHDSFLPVGAGVPSPSFVGDFTPPYPGPTGAALTAEELQSLTTAVGFSEAKLLDPDLFVGPRSAAKIVLGEDPPVDVDVDETAGFHNDFASPQSLALARFEIPNLLPPSDPLAGALLFADVRIVEEASIGLDAPLDPPESDYYSFTGVAGDVFQIEVLSTQIDHQMGIDDTFDPQVAVFADDLDPFDVYYGDSGNDDGKGTTDSQMIDLVLPESGTYVIEVFASDKMGADVRGEYELYVFRFVAEPPPVPALQGLGLPLLALALLAAGLWRRSGSGRAKGPAPRRG